MPCLRKPQPPYRWRPHHRRITIRAATAFGTGSKPFVLTHFRPFWAFVNGWPALARIINRVIVNNAVLKAPARPLALSSAQPYTSWASLTDRTWFSRYLPPRPSPTTPSTDALAELFRVPTSGPRLSQRSTLLFPSFAEWFTDGFLMTDTDRRKTRTNHQIDLSQVYGLNAAATKALRLADAATGGRLKSEIIDGAEWAPRLYGDDGVKRPEFADLPDPIHLPSLPPEQKASIFAFGGERANTTTFTAAINTLFLREHNRLCGILQNAHPDWDGDRVFETARNINIVILIKIVVEEYINHISPYWFKLLADPSPCYKAIWNRENWIPVEFNLLYRWHSLIPEEVSWNDAALAMADTRFDNRRLTRDGLGACLDSASRSAAWRIGLFNTAEMLRQVEVASIIQGRSNCLASYNDYRERMRYPRVTSFEQISGDPKVVEALQRLYGNVDAVEFFVGLFAEDVPDRSAVPALIGRMVASDAFSHALTNPLLAPSVYNDATFSKEGMAAIAETSTLKDLFMRNDPAASRDIRVSMEREGQPAFA